MNEHACRKGAEQSASGPFLAWLWVFKRGTKWLNWIKSAYNQVQKSLTSFLITSDHREGQFLFFCSLTRDYVQRWTLVPYSQSSRDDCFHVTAFLLVVFAPPVETVATSHLMMEKLIVGPWFIRLFYKSYKVYKTL